MLNCSKKAVNGLLHDSVLDTCFSTIQKIVELQTQLRSEQQKTDDRAWSANDIVDKAVQYGLKDPAVGILRAQLRNCNRKKQGKIPSQS